MSKLLAYGINLMDIYPEQNCMYPGGNELNIAVYACRLGMQGAFLGVFGTDASVPLIQQVLHKEGVDYSHCVTAQGENGLSWIRLKEGERVFTGYNDGGVAGSHPLQLTEEQIAYISGFDVVTSSLYGRVPASQLQKVCGTGVPLAYDFAGGTIQEKMLPLLPHLGYAVFSCAGMPREETLALLRHCHQQGSRVCLATLGAEGSVAYAGGEMVYQQAVPVSVVDTTGAGDSFLTAFLHQHIECRKNGDAEDTALRLALQKGAEYAATVCTQPGAIGYSFPIPPGSGLQVERMPV